MSDKKQKYYMLAERASGEQYWPDGVDQTLEAIYDSLEYGDVYEGYYQIWEYPSGKIYKIEPDRTVEDKDYYTPPSIELWKPMLTEIGEDKKKVTKAYEKLSKLQK